MMLWGTSLLLYLLITKHFYSKFSPPSSVSRKVNLQMIKVREKFKITCHCTLFLSFKICSLVIAFTQNFLHPQESAANPPQTLLYHTSLSLIFQLWLDYDRTKCSLYRVCGTCCYCPFIIGPGPLDVLSKSVYTLGFRKRDDDVVRYLERIHRRNWI